MDESLTVLTQRGFFFPFPPAAETSPVSAQLQTMQLQLSCMSQTTGALILTDDSIPFAPTRVKTQMWKVLLVD